MLSDLRGDVALLRHYGGDSVFRGQVDDRAHLGAKDTELHRPTKKRTQLRHRPHQLDTVILLLESLVDLYQGDDAPFFPQELRSGLSPHLAMHRAFEKDR